MKKFLLLFSFLAAVCTTAKAQFIAGSDGFNIKSGTPVAIHGLTLTPNTDVYITNKSLSFSPIPIAGVPTGSINRVYTFSSPLTFSGVLGIFYLSASELNGNDEASLSISYSSTGAGSFFVTSGSTPVPASDYVSNTVNSVAISSITAANAETALPVSLLNFNVRKEGRIAALAWTTTLESNSGSFEIQRSFDARNWEVLGEVNAAGESRGDLRYTFSDQEPHANESNYYRLRMIDHDGSFAYSPIRRLTFDEITEMTVYPNPTAGNLTLKVDDWSKVSGIQIINLQGVVVYDSRGEKFPETMATIEMKSLPTGAYVIRIKRVDGTMHALKVVRQ